MASFDEKYRVARSMSTPLHKADEPQPKSLTQRKQRGWLWKTLFSFVSSVYSVFSVFKIFAFFAMIERLTD
jgi:hypothetical protein